jgi:XapX domain-containing protein
MKFLIALVIAFLIGAACRYFELPAPAPPALQGALLVMAMSLGFIAVDRMVASPPAAPTPIVAPTPSPSSRSSDDPAATPPRT